MWVMGLKTKLLTLATTKVIKEVAKTDIIQNAVKKFFVCKKRTSDRDIFLKNAKDMRAFRSADRGTDVFL